MNVPSLAFLGFAACAAALFNASRALWWRRAVLLAANVAFFLSFVGSPLAYLPFVLFLAAGYAAALLMQSAHSRAAFAFCVVLAVAAFCWLKRYSFLPSASFLPFPYFLVGLSYVFFRVLHLIIDAHENALPGRVGLVSYVNYTLNFTSLVSGPIQRYQDYHRMESVDPLPLDLIVAGEAMERIVIGFFKVAVVSVALHALQDRAIAALSPGQPLPGRLGTGIVIAATYPVFLYFNFSGYTDFVIGVARFFRIRLPENFDRPFSSENFISFWSRWHITLSLWLKTYVYNPVMMRLMRRFPSPAVEPFIGAFAYFITFFLVGVWHGRTSEFVVFGVLQGLGVSVNKLYQVAMAKRLGRKPYKALCANPLYRSVARGLTFTWFAFTLLWFWSDWPQMGTFVAALGPGPVLLVWLCILAGAVLVLEAGVRLRDITLAPTWEGRPALMSRYVRTVWGTALLVTGTAVTVLLNTPAPDIVYKSF